MKAILFCKFNTAFSVVSLNLCASLMLTMHSAPGIQEMMVKWWSLQRKLLVILNPEFLSKYPSSLLFWCVTDSESSLLYTLPWIVICCLWAPQSVSTLNPFCWDEGIIVCHCSWGLGFFKEDVYQPGVDVKQFAHFRKAASAWSGFHM